MAQIDYDRAEMNTPQGRLGNPIPPGTVPIPSRIELEGDAIIWGLDPWAKRQTKPKKPPDDLVQEFARLADATPGEILDFARRYGVLGMDESQSFPGQPNFFEGIEPIERWRTMAREVSGLLKVAASLQNNALIDVDTIRAVSENALTLNALQPGIWFWMEKPFPPGKEKRAAIARRILDERIRFDWLRRFPSILSFERDTNGDMNLVVDHLFGLLSLIGLQVMQAVARKSVYFCSSCKLPFVRHGGSKMERRPKTGMERFCEQCGRAGALRLADERRKEKIRTANELHEKGNSPKQIAVALGVRSTATVTAWLQRGRRNAKKKTR